MKTRTNKQRALTATILGAAAFSVSGPLLANDLGASVGSLPPGALTAISLGLIAIAQIRKNRVSGH